MHLYYTSTLEGEPLVKFEWNRADADRTILDITKTVRKIETKDQHERVQNAYTCKFCDMRYFCKRDIFKEGALRQFRGISIRFRKRSGMRILTFDAYDLLSFQGVQPILAMGSFSNLSIKRDNTGEDPRILLISVQKAFFTKHALH